MSKEKFKEYAYFTYFILVMIPTFVFVLCNSWLGINGIYRTLKFGHILVTDNLISTLSLVCIVQAISSLPILNRMYETFPWLLLACKLTLGNLLILVILEKIILYGYAFIDPTGHRQNIAFVLFFAAILFGRGLECKYFWKRR